MHHEYGAADLSIHRFADVEGRRYQARFDRLCEHGTGRIRGPFDTILDLLGRMRFRKDVADEVLDKVRIVRKPMLAIVLVPTFKLFVLREEVLRRHVRVRRPDARSCADQDGGLHALRVMRGDDRRQHAAERNARDDRVARLGGIHHCQHIGDVLGERICGDCFRPIRPAIATPVERDAAKAFAEVGELRLVDARVDDAPRRQKEHRLGATPVDLVVELHAITFDETVLVGQLGTHDITSWANCLPSIE